MAVKLKVFVFRDGWIQSLHDVLKTPSASLYPLSSALLWGLPPPGEFSPHRNKMVTSSDIPMERLEFLPSTVLKFQG